ncbi:hypothetical protein B4098_3399 [Heyndrickxia coagulans]|uniref:Uncharacterized protein n=1 Tax=Heyndrickxia coagulans TaxID=1398 RepID=A0A150K5G5_HEYCO|nr:hypothetical protein B4098_3399 [Heyndrickxia coagulans]
MQSIPCRLEHILEREQRVKHTISLSSFIIHGLRSSAIITLFFISTTIF